MRLVPCWLSFLCSPRSLTSWIRMICGDKSCFCRTVFTLANRTPLRFAWLPQGKMKRLAPRALLKSTVKRVQWGPTARKTATTPPKGILGCGVAGVKRVVDPKRRSFPYLLPRATRDKPTQPRPLPRRTIMAGWLPCNLRQSSKDGPGDVSPNIGQRSAAPRVRLLTQTNF